MIALVAGLSILGWPVFYLGYRKIRGAPRAGVIVLAIVASMEGIMLSGLLGYYASDFAQPVRELMRDASLITAGLAYLSFILSANAYHKALRLYGSQRDD